MPAQRKLRVGLLFGGNSSEHDISLLSAASVIRHLDAEKYDVFPIGITREGVWLPGIKPVEFIAAEDHMHSSQTSGQKNFETFPEALTLSIKLSTPGEGLDVVFPVLHGQNGEDGTVQGLLELADLPYVGCGIMGSALGMDKEKARLIFRSLGLPVVNSLSYRSSIWKISPERILDAVEERLGYPNFVKPASLGSSIGVSKVYDRGGLRRAIQNAVEYDHKFLVEQAINCRELECSVLGNDEPMVSAVGEVFYTGEFYDYYAKYQDERSHTVVPASISPALVEEMRFLAIQAFQALDLSGMARVDFFLERETEKIFINEVNTLPSLTNQCMYSKLCEYSGLPYTHLLDRLIELALERHAHRHRLKRAHNCN
ncbi:D-alanine--D-alanine ligase family protein [Tengunoibacter tsumagoiensis]|uniref:D-alanine--D-alanine ligase n=1 Tax=Tengunoibacter tsumagoiensis TaxID=2014871 RepID=A0A402A9I4_9CHLR|nr:D-alanine--D-alanine ligase family protein [Tengunoibacter tsumagoiensis]GCE15666.1 D-alanine--D-alanine ligase [Tengunoibacter tsumagoiensis]